MDEHLLLFPGEIAQNRLLDYPLDLKSYIKSVSSLIITLICSGLKQGEL